VLNLSFSAYQWQWWGISPNSTKLGVGGAPPEVLHENHGVGACSIFFEYIRDGEVGAGKFG
jgi:hypothetical protein